MQTQLKRCTFSNCSSLHYFNDIDEASMLLRSGSMKANSESAKMTAKAYNKSDKRFSCSKLANSTDATGEECLLEGPTFAPKHVVKIMQVKKVHLPFLKPWILLFYLILFSFCDALSSYAVGLSSKCICCLYLQTYFELVKQEHSLICLCIFQTV